MICPACGEELLDEARFCHKCGTSLSTPGKSASADASAAEMPAASGVDRFRDAVASKQADDDDVEDDLWQGTYSKKAMFGAWIVAGFLTLAAVVFAIWIGFGWTGWLWTLGIIVVGWLSLYLRLLFRQLSVQYTLTTQRLELERGLLSRTTDRIEVIDMDDITFTQGPVQRLLGVGQIVIKSSDVTDPHCAMPGIDNVGTIARMMDDARRKERRRRGLHIEAI